MIEDHVSSRKAMFEHLLANTAKYEDPDLRAGQEKRLRQNIEILDRMQQKANTIRKDVNLSEAGMATQQRHLMKASLGEFAPLFEAADNLDQAYIREYAELSKVPDAPAGRSELATLLREQEIRAWAHSLTMPGLMLHYYTAVQNGDAEFVRAVRTAPGPALLPIEYVERVERERLQMIQKDKLARLESLDTLRKELRGLSVMIQNWLNGYEEVKSLADVVKEKQLEMASR